MGAYVVKWVVFGGVLYVEIEWCGWEDCGVGWDVEGDLMSKEFDHLFEVLTVYGVMVIAGLSIDNVRLYVS